MAWTIYLVQACFNVINLLESSIRSLCCWNIVSYVLEGSYSGAIPCAFNWWERNMLFLLIHFIVWFTGLILTVHHAQISHWLQGKWGGSVRAAWKSLNKGFQEEATEFINTRIYANLKDANRFTMASMTHCVNWSGTMKQRRTVQNSTSIYSDNPFCPLAE